MFIAIWFVYVVFDFFQANVVISKRDQRASSISAYIPSKPKEYGMKSCFCILHQPTLGLHYVGKESGQWHARLAEHVVKTWFGLVSRFTTLVSA